MKYLLILLALMVSLIPLPVEAACHNCIEAEFGYYDENPFINNYIQLDAAAYRGDGITSGFKTVYYEITAENTSTGYKKTYKGTDTVEGGKYWGRSVKPTVGWGDLVFTYHIKVTFKNGQQVWANKVTQYYSR